MSWEDAQAEAEALPGKPGKLLQSKPIKSNHNTKRSVGFINNYSRTEPTRPDPPKKHHTNASFGCKVKWARCPESCCVEQANP